MMPKTGRTTFIRASMGRIFRENLWLTVHCELGKRDLIVRGLTSGDVRFGSKADICGAKSHVRFPPDSDRESGPLTNGHVCFTPESGHVRCTGRCLLWANSGHQVHCTIRTGGTTYSPRGTCVSIDSDGRTFLS